MKQNPWPLGLTIVIAVFVVAVVIVGVAVSRISVPMAAENPYEQGLKYEERIEILKRTRALAERPEIAYDEATRGCTVRFADSAAAGVTGMVQFYRTDGTAGDISVDLHPNAMGVQDISCAGMKSGAWKVRLSWRRNGLAYYLEERLFIR